MANDTDQPLEVLDILDAPDMENEEVSFEKLFDFLIREGDIIIQIDKEQEETVRRGLAVVKHNYAKKTAKSGEGKATDKILKFNVVEEIASVDNPQIRLQIWLQKRTGVFVHRLVVSDKDL